MADSLAGRNFIVTVTLTRQEMLEERWTSNLLVQATNGDNAIILQWFACRHLIRNSYRCHTCNVEMALILQNNSTDGYQWYCNNCKGIKSLRDGSSFSHSHLSFYSVLQFIYFWVRGCPQEMCAYEAKIRQGSLHTVVSFCREVCEHWLEEHPQVIGGLDENGKPKVVDIDESKFFYRKYHQGFWVGDHWVFGGVERGTGKCFLVDVPDRTEGTLTSIIQKFILPGTIVVSDGKRTYGNLSAINGGIYEHVICHDQNFADGFDIHSHVWTHTRRRIKKQLKRNEALSQSCLHELLWKNWAKENDSDTFSHFLVCVWDCYP